LRKKIIAPRGPRSDLCVVVVTTSACSNGEGTRPAATSPEMCAMSARSLEFFFFFFFERFLLGGEQGERSGRGHGERKRERERKREKEREREREREEQAGIKEKKGQKK
jgi:hypothetical protein